MWEVRESPNKYYLVETDHENCEELLKTKSKFEEVGLRVNKPLDYESMRTIKIKSINPRYSAEEDDVIKTKIETDNTPLLVDQIIRIPNKNHQMKVKFQTMSMANACLSRGLLIGSQFIRPQIVELEKFVKLNPCYRCFAYNHSSNQCTKSAEYKTCSECGNSGHSLHM